MESRPTIGSAATPDELLDLVRRRQIELGLSNASLEDICLFAAGQIDKYLGPTRSPRWSPKLETLSTMLDALGLSVTLWIDATKVERFRKARGRQGRRMANYARPENGRISKALMKRAGPSVAREMGRKGAEARWKKSTPKQRKMVGKYLAAARKRAKGL